MEDRLARIAKKVMADAVETEDVEKPVHDIAIECSYDPEGSRIAFEESFTSINCSTSYNRDESFLAYEFNPDDYTAEDIFEITDYDELGDEFGDEYDYLSYISDFNAGEIAEIVISIIPLEELSSLFLEDFEGKNDFADWIEERSEDEEGDSRGMYGWLMDLLPEEVEHAINEKAKENVSLPSMENLWKPASEGDCGVGFKEGWSCFTTRGYSQGDCATVFGKSEDIDNPGVQKAIEHMLWDIPLYCRIEVDGEEYFVDSELEDNYDYDKNEVIEVMKRLMGDKWDDDIEEYLEDNLPDQPEYGY